MITTKQFWAGATERAVKTALQTFVAVLGVTIGATYTTESFTGLPWATAATSAAVATMLSLATSIGNANFTAGNQNTNIHVEHP